MSQTVTINPNSYVLDSGALEGADKFSRETALWNPAMGSPDRIINGVKPIADARGRDTVRNYGFASGAVALHKDGIVGAQYRLNSQPNWRVLSQYSKAYDDVWSEEYQGFVESNFRAWADSNSNWTDASGMNTLTGLVRLAVGIFTITGEVIATAEWLRDPGRPYNTAVQLVNSDRLCNPYGQSDTRFLRRGVQRNIFGRPQSFNFRMGDVYDSYPDDLAFQWNNVPATKPWGRTQVIYIVEQQSADQTRGLSDMVSALKNMRMVKKFSEVTLQSAVINATYAAAIESELPPEAVAAALGQNPSDTGGQLLGVYGAYMGALSQYLGAANNIRIDGAQIPHLFPGTKLNMLPVKTAGGVGTDFESSLMRHIAASLGLSYEELTRDFSKTNYSSGRAAMGLSARFQAARKKHVADRFANEIYALWLEEAMGDGVVPLPRGRTRDDFYLPLAKEAFTTCSWIGSGTGQVDELKETQAALLRIDGGISTMQAEAARLGLDLNELFQQRAKEVKMAKDLGLVFSYVTTKPNGIAEKVDQPGEEQSVPPAGDGTNG